MPKNHRSTNRAHGAGIRVRERTVWMFPVYARDRVVGEQPIYFIDQPTRDVWIEQGAVTTITAYLGSNRKRTAALRLLLNLPPKPQMSMTMGPAVVMAIMEGYREVAEAWSAGYRPYCEWPRAT
jgi:hypothetical protein